MSLRGIWAILLMSEPFGLAMGDRYGDGAALEKAELLPADARTTWFLRIFAQISRTGILT